MASKLTSHLKPIPVDKRLYDTIWAEVGGGSPDEVAAVASTFITNSHKHGYERALKTSTAYRRQSKEYVKAASDSFNAIEQSTYSRNKVIVDHLLQNPKSVMPFEKFENVKAFGDPDWAGNMSGYRDIGRQRFYWGEVKHGNGHKNSKSNGDNNR